MENGKGGKIMSTKNDLLKVFLMFVFIIMLSGIALAQDVNPDQILKQAKIYSPYVERTANDANLAEGVYWGDTHLHTNYSTDSGLCAL